MRNKFKAGNKVKCLRKNDGCSPYIIGEVYTVRHTEGPDYIRIDGPGLDCYGWGAKAACFEMVAVDPIAAVQAAVTAAEEALADSKRKLAEAQRVAEEASKEFKLEDIVTGLVVFFTPDGNYRVLVATGSCGQQLWGFHNPAKDMAQGTYCKSREEALRSCNNLYTKTTKTLKEIL